MKQQKLMVYDAEGVLVFEGKGILSVHEKEQNDFLPDLTHTINIIINRRFAGSVFINKGWTYTIEELQSMGRTEQ